VPTRDLIIYFSGDEETDGNTAQDTVKNHRELVDAEFALNADGGGGNLDEEDGSAISYSLQTSEKTYASFELTTHNPGGHSSAPGPDNAIYELADALQRLHAFQFPVMWNDTTIAYYKRQRAAQPRRARQGDGRLRRQPEGRSRRRGAQRRAGRGRQDPHHLRGDAAARRPRRERPAAIGDRRR
jgi:acetylornithine deacetylase/succinyl-diaminopimelate desuccinylase-like protein